VNKDGRILYYRLGAKMSKVYVSSTFEDLQEYRAAVLRALRRDRHDVLEVDNATTDRPVVAAYRALDGADIFVCVVAWRYGYVPEDMDNPDHLSVTELELQYAQRHRGLPCLIFLSEDGKPWPARYFDRDRRRIKEFRAKLLGSQVIGYFSSPNELAEKVLLAVSRLRHRDLDAFLSYPSDSRDQITQLVGRLRRDRLRIWFDGDLMPGDRISLEVEGALARARAVVFFVGRSGLGSGQNRELAAALYKRAGAGDGVRIIPVLLPGATPAEVPAALAMQTWIRFRDFDDPTAYRSLRDVLRNTAAEPPPPPPAPARPRPTDEDLQMLCELLFRLVVRLRERPELLQSLDATVFWAAVRKVSSRASTVDDLRSLNVRLGDGHRAGALWSAWVRNTRSTELAALLQPPEIIPA
jgi:Domain of unknown function (DUF4062)/TIR domain